MGVRMLNKYLKLTIKNRESINRVNLNALSYKTVVIDTSIYMYKFKEGNLYKNMYNLIQTFKKYNIDPIFIFDGIPPPEKNAILIKRKCQKELARKKFCSLKQQLATCNSNDTNKIILEMTILKKQFIYIKNYEISTIKNIMNIYGIKYKTASGEADVLCAKMVNNNEAYACMSEDMDLFLYGCKRIIKYLENDTIMLYNLNNILDDLTLSITEFRRICVLSGTEHNLNYLNIFKAMKLYSIYIKKNLNMDFYDWLEFNNYNINTQKMRSICNMFSL